MVKALVEAREAARSIDLSLSVFVATPTAGRSFSTVAAGVSPTRPASDHLAAPGPSSRSRGCGAVAFNQSAVPRWLRCGEGHADLEAFHLVRDVRFPLLRPPQEGIGHVQLTVDLIHIPFVLLLALPLRGFLAL